MMDAKRALEANDGDMEAAKQWLREKGLAASAKRDERENTQGAVALFLDGNVGAIVEKERETLTALSRNEGKPEQALPKIVEGRLGGFFKEVALLEQPYAKDDKLTITQLLGGAKIVRYAQVEIG